MRRIPSQEIPPTGLGPHPSEAVDFEELFRSVRSRMLAVASRITRDPESAADVVQMAFERAFRRRHQFRGQARVTTWLHRIVVNEALMWLRAEGRRPRGEALDTLPGGELADPWASPAVSLLETEVVERVGRSLGALSPLDQRVMERCALEGISHEDAGRELRLHPGAVKSRAYRARQRLRAELSDLRVEAKA